MLNERQFMIVELLVKTNNSISAEEISKIVIRSKRTVMRDLSSIKLFLYNNKIGELLVNVDKIGYRIRIDNEQKYEECMRKSVRDEEIILYALLNNEYITMEDLSDLLFVSKITASEKMNVIKETYGELLSIEVSHKGHRLNELISKKCLLLSNLIDTNTKYYLDKANINIRAYETLLTQIELSQEISAYFPNVLPQQITNIFVAAQLMQIHEALDSSEDFAFLFQGAGINYTKQTLYALSKVSDYCIDVNLHLSEKQIENVLQIIEKENAIQFVKGELSSQLYMHLKRILCYPSYIQSREIHNIANIKALYPFSFDLSIVFISLMQKLYGYQISNKDLIGLYFAVGMEKNKMHKHKVAIYSRIKSIANINKQILEENIRDCDVVVIDSTINYEINEFSLIVNNTTDTLDDVSYCYHADSILSDYDISEIKNLLEDISINLKVQNIFPKEHSFTYKVAEGEDWLIVLRNICNRLMNENVISLVEMNRILEREKSGNSLIIGTYCIPHCISTKEDFCVSIYVHLTKTMIVEGSSISHVLVTLMNPKINQNINIFKYLYRYINANEKKLAEINDYDEFIQFI